MKKKILKKILFLLLGIALLLIVLPIFMDFSAAEKIHEDLKGKFGIEEMKFELEYDDSEKESLNLTIYKYRNSGFVDLESLESFGREVAVYLRKNEFSEKIKKITFDIDSLNSPVTFTYDR